MSSWWIETEKPIKWKKRENIVSETDCFQAWSLVSYVGAELVF